MKTVAITTTIRQVYAISEDGTMTPVSEEILSSDCAYSETAQPESSGLPEETQKRLIELTQTCIRYGIILISQRKYPDLAKFWRAHRGKEIKIRINSQKYPSGFSGYAVFHSGQCRISRMRRLFGEARVKPKTLYSYEILEDGIAFTFEQEGTMRPIALEESGTTEEITKGSR